jgi:hypothetical protein
MPNAYIFADEAGCFTFKRRKAGQKGGPSDYFILTTVSAPAWSISDDLLHIRRELCLNGEPERDKLHATSDLEEVRNEVFAVLAKQPFRIDATVLKKTKAQPQTRVSEDRFYKTAWYYHFKHVGPKLARQADKMLITAAALGTKRTRAAFKEAVNETVQQVLPREKWEVAFHESCKDPLLWVADYCSWAIQKRWEHGDTRAYDLIRSKIKTEFDLFEPGLKEFY